MRKRRGWKRSELAERASVSYQHIYNIERGFNIASEEVLQRIANALETDLEHVMKLEAAA